MTTHVVAARYLGGVASNLSLEGTTIGTIIIFNAPGTNLTIGDAAAFDGFYTDGTIRVGSKTLTILNAGYANLGVLTNLNGGTLVAANGIALGAGDNLTGSGAVNAKIAAAAGSIIQASGNLSLGNATSPAGFHGDGELRVGTAVVTILDSNQARLGTEVTLGAGSTPGTLNVANGAVIDFDQAITGTGIMNSTNTLAKAVINNGAILGNSPTQQITLSGYVKGVGTFDNVTFTGTFDPGLSATLLSAGNLAFSPTSLLNMELGGTTRGGQYDALLVGGTLGLAGSLQVSLINGFVPAVGNTFDILDWDALTGTFATLALPALNSGLAWDTSELYTAGVVSVTSAGLPGDYNNDNKVNALDYVLWRKTLINGQQGYNTWRTHFGETEGGSSPFAAHIAVPEPNAILPLVCLLSLLLINLRIRIGRD